MSLKLNVKYSSRITPAVRWRVIQNLLLEESLAGGKSVIGREMAILKRLESEGYNNPDFWLNLNLGFKIRSILWLQNSGRNQLNESWGMFLLEQKQKKELDEKKKLNNMSIIGQISGIPTIPQVKPAAVVLNKKQNILDWIDGEEKEL